MKVKLKAEREGNFQFCRSLDLIELWVNFYYKEKAVVVFLDSCIAFDAIPALNILKRDKYNVFIKGTISELAFMEFETIQKACDFVYSFDYNKNIKWVTYNCGKLHTASK